MFAYYYLSVISINMLSVAIMLNCNSVNSSSLQLKSYLNILQSTDDLIHVMHWKRAEREVTKHIIFPSLFSTPFFLSHLLSSTSEFHRSLLIILPVTPLIIDILSTRICGYSVSPLVKAGCMWLHVRERKRTHEQRSRPSSTHLFHLDQLTEDSSVINYRSTKLFYSALLINIRRHPQANNKLNRP